MDRSKQIAPEKNEPAGNRKPLAVAGIAFLAGVLGTAVIMPRLTSPNHPAETVTKTEAAEEDTDTKEHGSEIKLAEAAKANAGIKTQVVTFATSRNTITAPGTVQANRRGLATISPPVSGKLARIMVNPGDTVRAGQPLAVLNSYDVAQAQAAQRDATLDAGQAEAAVQTARAQAAQMSAKLDGALTTLRRQKQLAQAGAFSQAPLASAQAEVSQAQSELTQAQTELQTKSAAAGRADRLMKDQLISQSDLELAHAGLQQSQARVAQAATRVALAKQALAREQKVYSGDLLSKQAVQSAEADVRAAQADLQVGRSQVRSAQAALVSARGRVAAARSNLGVLQGSGHTEAGTGQVTLYAPLGGVITELTATIGQTVERSTTLMTISNVNTVLVQANVPERDAARIKIGRPVEVTVTGYPGATYAGVVQTVGSRVDEKTRSLLVQCLVNNPGGRLKPGMFASVDLATSTGAGAISVPTTAIDNDGDKQYVYVAKGDGYDRRLVQTGPATASTTQIASGLRPGDRVVTRGVFVLKSESKKDELKGDDD